MPKRLEFFNQGGFYHLFNKSIDKKAIFASKATITLFKRTLIYYKNPEPECKFSLFQKKKKQHILQQPEKDLTSSQTFVCFAYAFMPNHFHLLLRQESEISLSSVLQRVLISFTRTYNKLNDRCGPIFLPQFKAVRVSNENQFKHVSRYIHLNPYSSRIVNGLRDLITCPLTSFSNYLTSGDELCETSYLLGIFANSKERYRDFVCDQARNQRQLEEIKKLTAL
jgi:putative transposase